ncbi:MAG: Ig-like domain-containing protein, partial [Rhodobacteraceae bacterium]|nr:Ig-like domain-containing protein [Paracoccaceae bacterium]
MQVTGDFWRFWATSSRRRAASSGGGGPIPNLPPVAVADTATVAAGTPTLINVRANDSDPEGGAITLVSASTATGTAVV